MPKMLALIVAGIIIGLFLFSFLDTRNAAVMSLVGGVVILGLFIYAGWLFVKSRKTANKADTQTRKTALTFEPMADKAVLYVYRPQFVGKLVGFDLILDNQLIGQTHGGVFFRLEVEPGRHELSGNKKCKQVFALEAVEGDVLYIQQEVLMGAFSGGYQYRGALSEQEVKQARSDIKGCAMYLPSSSHH